MTRHDIVDTTCPSTACEQLLAPARRRGMSLEHQQVRQRIRAVSLEQGEFRRCRTERLNRASLRGLCSGRLGAALCNGEMPSADVLLDRLAASAVVGPATKMDFQAACNVSHRPETFSPEVESLTQDELRSICRSTVAQTQEIDPAVSCDVSCETQISELALATTQGCRWNYRRSTFHLAIWVRRCFGDRVVCIHDTTAGIRRQSAESLVSQVIEELRWGRREIPRVPAHQMQGVLLAPSVLHGVVNMLLAMVSAPAVLAGESILSSHFGERIFSEQVSLVDENVSDWGLRSAPCDDEGTPAQSTMIIRDGVLEAYLADRMTASMSGFPATSNGRKHRGRTMTGHSNVRLLTSQGWSRDELMRMLGRGVYVGTAIVNCNIRGEIMIIPRNAYLVEHGTVIAKLSSPQRLTTTLHELLRGFEAMGDELKLTRHDMMLPHILTRTIRFE